MSPAPPPEVTGTDWPQPPPVRMDFPVVPQQEVTVLEEQEEVPYMDVMSPTSPVDWMEEEDPATVVPVPVPTTEGLVEPPLPLPTDFARRTKEELDKVASAISAMAGKPPCVDLASSVSSVASIPQGEGQEAPDHHKVSGLGRPADWCIFIRGTDGELVMTDRSATSRPSLSRW